MKKLGIIRRAAHNWLRFGILAICVGKASANAQVITVNRDAGCGEWAVNVVSVENTGKQSVPGATLASSVISVSGQNRSFWRLKAQAHFKPGKGMERISFSTSSIVIAYRTPGMGDIVAKTWGLLGGKAASGPVESSESTRIRSGEGWIIVWNDDLDIDLLFEAPANTSDVSRMTVKILDCQEIQIIPNTTDSKQSQRR